MVHSFPRAPITKFPGLGLLNHRSQFSHTSGGCTSKVKVSAGLFSPRPLSLAWRWPPSYCALLWSLRTHPQCLSTCTSWLDQNPPNSLTVPRLPPSRPCLQTPSHSEVLGGRPSTDEFGRTQLQALKLQCVGDLGIISIFSIIWMIVILRKNNVLQRSFLPYGIIRGPKWCLWKLMLSITHYLSPALQNMSPVSHIVFTLHIWNTGGLSAKIDFLKISYFTPNQL